MNTQTPDRICYWFISVLGASCIYIMILNCSGAISDEIIEIYRSYDSKVIQGNY